MTDPLVSREKHQLSTVIMVGVVALLVGGVGARLDTIGPGGVRHPARTAVLLA